MDDIGDAVEVKAVDVALESLNSFDTARRHLEEAIRDLSNRVPPRPLKAAREAVFADESAARCVTGARNLSDALGDLKRLRPDLHPALLDG
ncbi:hypothetical protein ACH3VR_10685 [Microbacterium sp. B2969]|uniref:Uncharacterized protein n=1 Tax=Microbacterium alkaliflavum TaxID=3248839 RepID=A0ABW7Q7I2_9MICO